MEKYLKERLPFGGEGGLRGGVVRVIDGDTFDLGEGLANVTDKDSKYASMLLAREDEAKKLKRGIWSSLCQPKEGCLIKGSFRRDKGTKIYHLPGCFNYERIVIREREGDRWFCSEEEAKTAGFRKSEDCPE